MTLICSITASMAMMVRVSATTVFSASALAWVTCSVSKFRRLTITGVASASKCEDGRCRYFCSTCSRRSRTTLRPVLASV
ncbi:hypothetical protein D3C72_1903090 [compost metagenome]